MQWSIIKSWAKDQGFSASRKKVEGSDNKYDYYWQKDDDTTISGSTTSISKLATIIFNVITNNQHLEYQEEYKKKQAQQDIDHNELSGQW